MSATHPAPSDIDVLYHRAALDHGFKPCGTCDDCGTPLLVIDRPLFTDAGYEAVVTDLLAASALTVEAMAAAEHDYHACVAAQAAR